MNYYKSMTQNERNIYLDGYTRFSDSLLSILKNISNNIPEYKTLDKVCYTNYKNDEDNGEFGYYFTPSFSSKRILDFLLMNNIQSICDLGSGAGLLLKALKAYNYTLRVKGYENEPLLVDVANKIFGVETEQKDIIRLKRKDINSFQCIYIWEPFRIDGLRDEFFNNLFSISPKGQYIIYYSSSNYHLKLERNERISIHQKIGNYDNPIIYKVK